MDQESYPQREYPQREPSGFVQDVGTSAKLVVGGVMAIPLAIAAAVTAVVGWAGYKVFGPVASTLWSPFDAYKRQGLRSDVQNAGQALKSAHYVASVPGASDTAKELAADAAKNYNNAVHDLNLTRGKLGSSLREMGRSIAKVFGADTSNWGSTHIPKNIDNHMESVLGKGALGNGKNASVIERVISKPFRIAANNPRIALVTGAALATAGVASWLSGNRERETQQNAMAQMADAQMMASQNPYRLQPGEFTRDVEPKMRDSSAAAYSHADAVRTAQAAATNPAQAAS